MMISAVTFGTNNLTRAIDFYEALFAGIGIKRMIDSERAMLWGTELGNPMFGVIEPFNKKPATVGNGTMVTLLVNSAAQVDAIHKQALEIGATDEGAPGFRGSAGSYLCYIRDLDGNKLAFCYRPKK